MLIDLTGKFRFQLYPEQFQRVVVVKLPEKGAVRQVLERRGMIAGGKTLGPMIPPMTHGGGWIFQLPTTAIPTYVDEETQGWEFSASKSTRVGLDLFEVLIVQRFGSSGGWHIQVGANPDPQAAAIEIPAPTPNLLTARDVNPTCWSLLLDEDM